jgi:serine/threonine protein kinase/WD40 repeat protein
MSDSESSSVNSLDALAEEFVARHRRGEHPSMSEYAEKYSELADDIRDLFPGLLLIENVRPEAGESTGPFAPVAARPGLERLGDYRILREIGHGGMGFVYEAEQMSLDRHVALKVLPAAGLMNPTFPERFRREAKAAARLHHTNIVPVFGVGEADGFHFYAMQFIQGQSLDQVLSDVRRLRKRSDDGAGVDDSSRTTSASSVAQALLMGQFDMPSAGEPEKSEAGTAMAQPVTPAEPKSASGLSAGGSKAQYFRSVARVGLQAADALAYAHRQGILHRDIKPSNLLLDQQGTVWITDFGLAKAEGTDELTHTGDIVGTIRFMAPERFDGRSQPQSDVYSLGLTLYELLTLRPAFHETIRERLIEKVLHDPPVPPRKLDPHIPRDLETIVLKCLAKDAADRYATAEELAEDLRRFMADRTIRARRAGQWERLWRWARRNPTVAGLTGGLLTLGFLVCVGSIVAAMRLGQAAEKAQNAERATQEQLTDSLFVQARAGRSSQRPGQRLESLKALAEAAPLSRILERGPEELAKLRNEAIACLALPDARLEREWEGNPTGTSGLAFDAGCERYAWSGADSSVSIRRVTDHAELVRLPTLPAEFTSRWVRLRFSPDGHFLSLWYTQWTRLHALEVWDVKPGVSRPLLSFADATDEPGFAPDGRTVAVGLTDNTVRLFDLAIGQESQRISPGFMPSRLAFHPGGHLIAVASTEKHSVQIHDLEGGKLSHTLAHPSRARAVAWHPDGSRLATGCDDRLIYLWDATLGKKLANLEGHGWDVEDLAFSASGEWLASFGWEMSLRLWDVATRRQLWQMDDVRVLGFHRGVEFMASTLSGNKAQLWSFLPSSEFNMLRHPQVGILSSVFSPDRRWLAASDFDGTTWLWDVLHKREVARVPDEPFASWDPSGKLWLATKKNQLICSTVQSLREAGKEGARLGPPEILLTEADGFKPGAIAWLGGEDQLVLVFQRHGFAQMFALRAGIKKRWERAVGNAVSFHTSPDGRWLAVGSEDGGDGVLIFEAPSGKSVRKLPIGDAVPMFSPDSLWLVTTTGRLPTPGGECCLWRTDTWEKVRSTPLRRISSTPALLTISPDGSLLAVVSAMNEIRLMRLETLEEIATMTAPESGIILGIQIDGDGRYLSANVTNSLHIWDLHRLRQSLREIDLDWDSSGSDNGPNGDPKRDTSREGKQAGRDTSGTESEERTVPALRRDSSHREMVDR